MNYATETARKLRMIEAYTRDDALALVSVAADLIEKLEHCAQWANESLTRAVCHYTSGCECEPCPECGKMPQECTGTDCAQTCQCSDCDHCNFEGIIEFIGETLKGPNGEVRGASRPAGEASSAEGATSTVVLAGTTGRKD